MSKFLLAKMSSLAFAISSATLLSGCGTTVGKPELCNPGVQPERCAKVPNLKVARTGGQSHSSY